MRAYADRHEAGRLLAERLNEYSDRSDVQVLALPRGGVAVGYEVALALNVPLDVFMIRKLGVPMHEELAMGAVASGGGVVLNEEVIRMLGITENMIQAAVQEEMQELERRERIYRREREPLNVADKIVILVDDGLATGASMRAAVRALKLKGPAKIVVAVPIGSSEICEKFSTEVDEVICGESPDVLTAVGSWYQDFTQVSDSEVCEMLNHVAHQHRVRRLLARTGFEPAHS